MKYKRLGSSGLRVSELALGTMTFGETWGWGASQAESHAMFDRFASAGGNFIDTACNYTDGTSETYVGECIAADRDHFVVATKYTLSNRKGDLNFGGNHRKNLYRSLKASLERLKTDFIDLLWLHVWDDTTPIEEIMRGLDDLVRAGTVHYVGISDSPSWVVSSANTMANLRGWTPCVAVQVPYSIARRDAEREVLPMAHHFGLSVTPWGVLSSGILTGKYNTENDQPKRFQSAPDRGKGIAEAVGKVAADVGKTPAQVAINWVRQQGQQIIPILGARNVKQLEDNLGALNWQLGAAELQTLAQASQFEVGFPRSFTESDNVRDLIFGDAYSRLQR